MVKVCKYCGKLSMGRVWKKAESDEEKLPATCPNCSKANTQYFVSVFQLRNPNEEIVAAIHKEFDKAAQKSIFCTKEKVVTNGIDYYLTSNGFVRDLAKILKNKFGGETKLSPKLFTLDKNTSKELFRLNALYKAPSFAPGFVIEYKGDPVLVKSTGKLIKGLNLRSKKNIALKFNEHITVLEKKKTTIVKVKPQLEVIDPQTFQSEVVIGQGKNYMIGDTVYVVNQKGLFII